MAWTDLARVKRYLALAADDTADDLSIQDSIDAAQVMAETARAGSGYAPSVTAPDDACAEAVTRWAALLFQARGTGEGFAGFVDAGQTIGTPYYEQRRTILMLLGTPKPSVDGKVTTTVEPPGEPVVGIPAGGDKGQSLVKLSATDYDVGWDTPLTRAQARYAYRQASFVNDPRPGGMGIDVSGSPEQRGLCFSETDLDGKVRNLATLLQGDTLILSNPATGGFARYVITGGPMDQGGWWTMTAARTDTGGSTTPPPLETPLLATFTLAGGA